jgi:hypothetical protein
MKQISLSATLGFAICALAVLTLTSCSSTHSTQPLGETTRTTMYKEGVPGGVIVETTTLNATVAAIDTTNRTVTVAVKDGRRKVIGCGPEVVNFDQIRVGDHVRAVIKSELVLALAGTDAPKIEAGEATAALAPKGDKPGGVMTETQEYTAIVTAISQNRREVTLRLPDDTTRTFPVRPDIDLSKRKVGTPVAVRVSVAVAIAVESP